LAYVYYYKRSTFVQNNKKYLKPPMSYQQKVVCLWRALCFSFWCIGHWEVYGNWNDLSI